MKLNRSASTGVQASASLQRDTEVLEPPAQVDTKCEHVERSESVDEKQETETKSENNEENAEKTESKSKSKRKRKKLEKKKTKKRKLSVETKEADDDAESCDEAEEEQIDLSTKRRSTLADFEGATCVFIYLRVLSIILLQYFISAM